MVKRAHFEIFQKNLKYILGVFFDEESKTGLGFEIRQRQQNVSISPVLTSGYGASSSSGNESQVVKVSTYISVAPHHNT